VSFNKNPAWEKFMKKIAVIGAGLSGLTFTSSLNAKAEVTVFEKSRGIGGRMATRYAEHYEFDHGAQYFTAKGEAFQNFLEPYLERGIVKNWKPNLITLSKDGAKERVSNHPSYVGSPRMNALAKEMAADINLVGNTHIDKVTGVAGAWQLFDKEGSSYGTFDEVVFAIPSHQAAVLMPESFEYMEQIKHVKMDACFSLMLGFENPLNVDFDGAFVEGSSIGWISVNSSKPQRPQGFSMMVQSQNQWAETHVDEDKDKVQAMLLEEASGLLNHDLSKADHQVLHRWLYASTSVPAEQNFFHDEKNQLACIGDWCIKGRVEAAFESGHRLAEKMASSL
jgi:predicted NAD/FAD-dependent oxidoreductase